MKVEAHECQTGNLPALGSKQKYHSRHDERKQEGVQRVMKGSKPVKRMLRVPSQDVRNDSYAVNIGDNTG